MPCLSESPDGRQNAPDADKKHAEQDDIDVCGYAAAGLHGDPSLGLDAELPENGGFSQHRGIAQVGEEPWDGQHAVGQFHDRGQQLCGQRICAVEATILARSANSKGACRHSVAGDYRTGIHVHGPFGVGDAFGVFAVAHGG